MKIITIAVAVLSSFAFFPVASLAECKGKQCFPVTVKRFIPTENGIDLDTSGNEANLTICAASPTGFLRLRLAHPNYDIISALLLTAHESQKPISIRLEKGESEVCIVKSVWSDR